MNSAIRSQREVIRGMLADLKMPGALEAVDGILGDIDILRRGRENANLCALGEGSRGTQRRAQRFGA